MGNLKCRSRGSSIQGKPNIYFCCHPQDFEQYFDIVTDAIISSYDCVVWYQEDLQRADADFSEQCNTFKCFIVPVTTNLLYTPNIAIDVEIPLAKQSNIIILPIMVENGLELAFFNKLGDICAIKWNLDNNVLHLENQLKMALSAIIAPQKTEGSWIFLSHSSADIQKVREIRNRFEKNQQNPLAFHLKCLKTDTPEDRAELEGLIKREIDARDWFVFCESEAARESKYVTMEKEYIVKSGKKKVWSLDMSLPIDELLKKVDDICVQVKIFISYRKRNQNIINVLSNELARFDFDVWYDEKLLPGEQFDERIYKEIAQASKYGFFVAIISEGDEMSYTVQHELPVATMNEARIIVISIGDVNVIETYFDASKVKHYNLPNMPTIEDIGLIAKLIEAETRRQIKGPICQADAYNAIAKIEEQLNYKHRYHSQEAILDHVTGSSDDYLEIYRFPCCGKTVVVGDGPVSRFRADGCCCNNE